MVNWSSSGVRFQSHNSDSMTRHRNKCEEKHSYRYCRIPISRLAVQSAFDFGDAVDLHPFELLDDLIDFATEIIDEHSGLLGRNCALA